MIFKTVRIIDPVSLHQEVGSNIRREREAAQLSQAQLAAHLSMTRASVSNIEAGNHAIMLSHVYNIALFLDLPISRLLPELGSPIERP